MEKKKLTQYLNTGLVVVLLNFFMITPFTLCGAVGFALVAVMDFIIIVKLAQYMLNTLGVQVEVSLIKVRSNTRRSSIKRGNKQ